MAHESAVNELILIGDHAARIAEYRERLDRRLRHPRDGSIGIYPLGQGGTPPPAAAVANPAIAALQPWGEIAVRKLIEHPVLFGVAAGALFLAGPRNLLALSARGWAFWKLASPFFRH